MSGSADAMDKETETTDCLSQRRPVYASELQALPQIPPKSDLMLIAHVCVFNDRDTVKGESVAGPSLCSASRALSLRADLPAPT